MSDSQPSVFPQPYPGLRPFDFDDAPLFFGRHTHVAEMLALLEEQRFLAVVGASGSGKSSLVRSGLLPAIADGYLDLGDESTWQRVIARPGDDPFGALAEELVALRVADVAGVARPEPQAKGVSSSDEANVSSSDAPRPSRWSERATQEHAPQDAALSASPDARLARTVELLRASQYGLVYALRELGVGMSEPLVLVVDQFEELFRFRRDESTRQRAGMTTEALRLERRNEANAFVNLLLKSAEQTEHTVVVILTMRSDFLGDCDAFIGLPEAISRSQYLTPRLTRSQLEEAIRAPLARPEFGQQIAEDLVTRILNDVGSEPDQLPLMQHALMRMWQAKTTSKCRMGTPARLTLASSHPPASDETAPLTSLSDAEQETGESARPTTLTIKLYKDVGEVSGALNNHADEIFDNLGNANSRERLQGVAQRLFCSLSERRDNGPLTRRPITIRDASLEAGAELADVIEVARAFYVTNLLTSSPVVKPDDINAETKLDISHESLLRQWHKLQKWIETEARWARQYRRLREEVDSGVRFIFDTQLDNAVEWQKTCQPTVSWAMRYEPVRFSSVEPFFDAIDLIAASVAERQRRFDEEQERERARLAAEADAERAREAAQAALREQALLQEKADLEQARATDADRAARRFKLQRKFAFLASVVAVVFLLISLDSLWDARVATHRAVEAEGKARQNAIEAGSEKQKAIEAAKEAADNEAEAKKQAAAARAAQEHAKKFEQIANVRLYANQLADAKREFESGDQFLGRLKLDQTQSDLRGWEYGFVRRVDPLRLTLEGHSNSVRSVSFSPDGKRIVSGSDDKTVKVWDAATGQDTLSLKGHSHFVTSVSFSPDGKRIVSGSADNTVKVWDAATGQETLTLTGHSGYVLSVSFSPDGKRIVSGSGDNTVKVWDAATGLETLTLKGPSSAVLSVSFSPDGKRIVSGSGDNTVKVWDATTGQETLTLKGHSGSVWSVSFSPDGQRIVSGSADNTVKVWDATTGQETLTIKGHSSAVVSVSFSPDWKRIVSGSDDDTVKVWDAATGQETLTLKGHSSAVLSVSFSLDGKRIVSGSDDNTVKVWDAATGHETFTSKGHSDEVTSISFSLDGKRIVSGSFDNTLKVWDAATGQETLTLNGHSGGVTSVSFSPDGQRIVSGSYDKTLKVWDAATGQETLTLKGHSKWVSSVSFSPDGKRIASGSFDNTLKVWDAATGQETLTLNGHSEPVCSVGFSPDGKRIVSGSDDKTLKVWDAATGQETLTLNGHLGYVSSVSFSPDGKQIVSGSDDKTLKVWDAATGQETLTLNGHSESVWSVSFSPDWKRIVSGSRDNTVKVWDAATGQETLTLKGHSGSVRSVSFSPNGQRIVSGSDDGTIKVWDAATGQETLTDPTRSLALPGNESPRGSASSPTNRSQVADGNRDSSVPINTTPKTDSPQRSETGSRASEVASPGGAWERVEEADSLPVSSAPMLPQFVRWSLAAYVLVLTVTALSRRRE